jgi:hypothetical protein
MPQTTLASRLRYLAAADVDDTVVDYDGLPVVGADGDRLGGVEGFIVDAAATRLLYVVVDSGGWFSSRRVLIPVGHASLSADRKALTLDVARDALTRYPAFREDGFQNLSDEDMRLFEQQMLDACCPDDKLPAADGAPRHYAQPDWWSGSPYAHERLRPVDMTASDASLPRESGRAGSGPVRAEMRRDDASPGLDDRAQPGDVIGIETGGGRTHVGDSPAAENSRRVAERALGTDDEEPRRSER